MKEWQERAHWEKRRGTPEEASDYCKKDKKFVERGTLPKQGARSDLAGAVEILQKGGTLDEVDPVVVVKYHKGLKVLRGMRMKDREAAPTVTWLWGATGSGKTREAAVGSFYMKDGTRWWDGYEQQDRIVIDDFDGSWPFRDLLRLLDRYPYQGQTKGGYVKINSPHIYITCEFPPSHYWTDTELAQISRRISTVEQKC